MSNILPEYTIANMITILFQNTIEKKPERNAAGCHSFFCRNSTETKTTETRLVGPLGIFGSQKPEVMYTESAVKRRMR